MQYSDLAVFYQNQWVLKYHHHYSIDEQYMLLPYERDLHLNNIVEHLKTLRSTREQNS